MLASDKSTSENTKISLKEISFPKGGGAAHGLGDSFKANLFSGAGTYSIPIPLTEARGFEPQLSVDYSSGAGNGIFGLGFSLSLSKISVKSNKRIPKYDGTDQYELDGAILVVQNNTLAIPNPRKDKYKEQDCLVTIYITQMEGSFSQIEHWQNRDTGLSFWKVISAANTTSYYGLTTRIANPDRKSQIFEWLIDSELDNKGNQIIYNYVAENAINVPDNIYEVNRSNAANRYIDTIQYGNYTDAGGELNFAFEVCFNYGQSSMQAPQQSWTCRPDPFSFYNSGFEIRTYRLCQYIQIVHHFPDELGAPLVVKEIAFTYENIQQYTPVQFQGMSMLTEVSLKGFRKELTEPQLLPPLKFGYSAFRPPITPEFRMLRMGEDTIPGYFKPTHFLPVDLNGEGLPGFLLSNNLMSLYIEPLGHGKYALPQPNASFPVYRNIQENESILTDLDGNGQLELVVNVPGNSGFYQRALEGGWTNFVPFEQHPNVIADPKMELVDLSANGKSDLLLVETNNLQYYPSDGKKGYSAALNIPAEDDFPLIKPQYEQELVTFSSLFGDGLSHRVKISSGSVECWPCLGYGKFGEKVTLANAPVFDGNFDVNRLFLTDVDGSGTTDLAYVYPDRVELFLNESGNSFSAAVVIKLPELFDTIDQISFADILGNGTACLVFTKIAIAPRHYYYNFSGEFKMPDGSLKESLKPYLLNEIDNNMGSVSYINYCSSTQFFLDDKLRGTPWVTKLPFPVQVVEEVILYEQLSSSKYVSKYKYHDGYYNPDQKQFLGFGFVESWDTESYEEFQAGYSNPDYPTTELNQEIFVPPVYTKSWYLNGAPMLEYEMLMAKYKKDYFNKDTAAYNFPNSHFSADIYTSNEKTFLQAYKALSSSVLRTEVYALDGTPESANPYSVEESNYSLLLIQSAAEQSLAVFMLSPRESITYHYERNYTDPRVEQHFVLETDPLCGQPLRSCIVYLPRRGQLNQTYPEQYLIKSIISTERYYNSPDTDFTMRLRGIKYEEQGFNLFGIQNPVSGYFSFEDIFISVQTALGNIIPYLAKPSSGLQAGQLNKSSFYYCDPGTGVLPFGQVSPQVLLHHIATAEFTNDNISSMFGQRLTKEAIGQLGGYVYDPQSAYWENQGLIQSYRDATGFYLPSGTDSVLNTKSTVAYDAYDLAVISTTSYVSPTVTNVVEATIDYQAMAIKQMVDINGNVSQALFDALGQVIVTALFGTENGQRAGDMLLYPYGSQQAEYILRTTAPDGQPIDFDSVIKDEQNMEYYLQGAGSYFYYDINAYAARKQPINSIHLQRRNYVTGPAGTNDFSCLAVVTYNDGLGRNLAIKTKVEPEDTTSRWLVSGRSVYNNKGKVCESYLPYFSSTPLYQTQKEITSLYQVPPPEITQYDPLLRVIRIDTPKGFFSKVEFDAWEQVHYDEDDTVKDSVYYQNFMANYPVQPTADQIEEKKALEMAAGFYNTPTRSIIDNIGNEVRTIQVLNDQQTTRQLITFYTLDIQGRRLTDIDPRLYASNINTGTSYYNFRYQYAMTAGNPMLTDSADAGVERHFSNIFDNQVWSLSPRDYCQVIYYDGLQRQTELLVKKVPGTDPITGFDSFNLVEVFTYGEDPAAPTNANLRGQIYILKDLSGILTNDAYSMLGSVLETNRQMTSVYKTAVNWHDTVPLDTGSCTKIFSYNALNLLLTETIQDQDIVWNTTINTYNQEGMLNSIVLTTNSVNTTIIEDITYDANRQRTLVKYGNGLKTAFSYEASTLRLSRIFSQRGLPPSLKVVQDIAYTYDPVGNITCTRDSSIDVIFNNNQKVDPVSRYNYDSLYHLIQASGRQHPGITANTYKNNTTEGSFMQSKFSQTPLSNMQAIENYTENYAYDDSGNLIKKQHLAVSSPWAVETPVLDNCNRLQGLSYDASGNQQQLSINNVVSLVYNCCENLVSAAVIERPAEANDADYYVYDFLEQRTRKVNELYINAGSCNYKDTFYFGNYESLHSGIQNADGTRTVTMNRQCLRIMDDSRCVAIVYHWIAGGPAGNEIQPAPDQLRYQLDNNLGSVGVELDEQGLLISYEEFFPYGGTSFIAGPNQVDVALKVYRYSGKECDNSTGLYYYGRRYYVSWLGRWLNPDPAGTVDGLNLFAFVGGNPVTDSDEDGLKKKAKGAVAVANEKRRKYLHTVAKDTATFSAPPPVGNTQSELVVHSWNTQNKDGRALASYTMERRGPDVLLVQEAGSAPRGAVPSATTGVSTGSVVVQKKQRGTTTTKSETVHYAHVNTGSKNLMILSLYKIKDAHLVRADDDDKSWRFRPALAAQVEGLNLLNIHLVSGVPKLAAKHLESVIDRSASAASTLLAGDANQDADTFTSSSKKRKRTEMEVFAADAPTHNGGGALDHGVLFHTAKKKKFTEGDSDISFAKGSDHKIRKYYVGRRKNGTWGCNK